MLTRRPNLKNKGLLGLKSNQGDATSEFLHAGIGEGEIVYVNIPKVFDQYKKNRT